MALLDSWYPVTGDFGLIDAPRERFASAYHQWHCDLEKRPSRSKPEIGSFRTETIVTNQDDVAVLRFVSIVLIRRRYGI